MITLTLSEIRDGTGFDRNARFVSADVAQDLLAALQDVAAGYQQLFDVMPVAWQTYDHIVSAAIAKAKCGQTRRSDAEVVTAQAARIRDIVSTNVKLYRALLGLKGLFDFMGGRPEDSVSFRLGDVAPLYAAARAALLAARVTDFDAEEQQS